MSQNLSPMSSEDLLYFVIGFIQDGKFQMLERVKKVR